MDMRLRSRLRVVPLAILISLASALGSAPAFAEGQREPVIVVGLRPAKGTSLDGPTDIRGLGEAQHLRRVIDDAVRLVAQRPIIDDQGLRAAIGVEYLVDFVDCRGRVTCVAALVARLRKVTSLAIYGSYVNDGSTYHIRMRLIDVRRRKLIAEVEFKLDEGDIEDRKLWRRQLEPLFTAAEGTSGGAAGTQGMAGSGAGSGSGSGSGSGEEGSGSGSGSGSGEGSGSGDNGGVPELAPITTDNGGGGSGSGSGSGSSSSGGGDNGGGFIDNSVLDAINRGVALHGHFQSFTALGVHSPFKDHVITFEERLQLEFESDINQVRVIGKPQLIYDVLSGKLDPRFREAYATRDYKRFDLAIGAQILTWGVTDFWPVVDILNPRDFSTLRNWRPIDEKIPIPAIKSTILLGPVTVHLIGIPILGTSMFQLDPTKPFALPIPAIPGTTSEQRKVPTSLSDAGGGTRIDVALAAWKVSLYALVGRDPLPSVYAQTDPSTGATKFVVDDQRVAMAATSVQGNLDVIGAILKAEFAAYHRLDDGCDGMTANLGPLPECFYLRRTPTARMNIALEHTLVTGLDAHLQFISEYTRGADIPHLPAIVGQLAPGLPQQYPWNRMFTLRLQGNWKGGDFQPMAFAYWSIDDQSLFVNVDLEYHLADGFALALGGFIFDGYASNPNKNRYTLIGSLQSSSNVYLKATAWF